MRVDLLHPSCAALREGADEHIARPGGQRVAEGLRDQLRPQLVKGRGEVGGVSI